MSAPTGYTWVCSACGRNVPRRVPRCHCGALREQALDDSVVGEPAPSAEALLAAPGWRGIWRTLPGNVRAMVVTAALLVLGGVASLVVSPPGQDLGPALLGRVDNPRPQSSGSPAFELPWWK